MKISLYRKAPKCPRCRVPMKFESMAYSDRIKKLQDVEHKKNLKDIKKGEFYGSFVFDYDLEIYRCLKCFDLYKMKVEE